MLVAMTSAAEPAGNGSVDALSSGFRTALPAEPAPLWFRLPNGLEVVIEENHRQPEVAVVVAYGVGIRDDPQGYGELAHLVEHMTFRGSRHLKEGLSWTLLERAGAREFGGFTGFDFTEYFTVVPTSAFDFVLFAERERMAFTLESFSGAAAIVLGLVLGCRSSLPKPVGPLTRTPDSPDLAGPPAFGAAQMLRPPVVIREELANGLTVWIVERSDVSLESIAYVDRAARDDAAEESRGLALFSAQALALGSNERARVLEPLVGSELVASLADAGTSLRITGEETQTDAAMERLATAIRRPQLTPKLLEDVRRAELASIAATDGSGRAVLTRLAAEQLYGEQALANRSLVGTSHKVSWFVVDDVQRFLRAHYGPRTAALVLVGAIDRGRALELAQRHFGDWRASSSESPLQGQATVAPSAPKGLPIWAVEGGWSQAMMVVAWPCPRAVEPESLPFGLLSTLLGGMVRSRIFIALRETQGLSYHVHARCVERRESANFF